MASKIYSSPRSREFTTAGTVLAGGKLYFYVAGTTTPATVYTSSALSVAHSHPILADTSGLFPAVWLSANVSYDITCKNSAGATQWTALNYSDALLRSEVGAALYPQTAAEIAAGVTPTDYAHEPGDVRRYGFTGDGSTDNTTAFQNALNANAGFTPVTVPNMGNYAKLTSRVTAPADTTIVLLDGAELRWTATTASGTNFLSAATRPGIEVTGDNFTLEGSGILRGPTSAAYVSNECAIYMAGTSTSVRKSGLTIRCAIEITDWGSYGVLSSFTDDISISDPRVHIHGIGYCGVLASSCNHGRVTGIQIGNITPGTSGDAYGLSLSSDTRSYNTDPNAGTKQAANPFCWDWVVDGCTVYDVPIWRGLDAHGAYETHFINNNIFNCGLPIGLSASSGDAAAYAGWDNSVINNVIDARKRDGTATTKTTHGGIIINGGSTVRHHNINCSQNKVYGYGLDGAWDVISAVYVADAIISDNQVGNWGGVGIYTTGGNGIISDNTFGNVSVVTNSKCINMDATSSGAWSITGNRHRPLTGNTAAEGLRIASGNPRSIVGGNDFDVATTPYAGSAATLTCGQSDLIPRIQVTGTPTTIDVGDALTTDRVWIEYAGGVTTVTDLTNAKVGTRYMLHNVNAVNLTFDRTNAALAGGANAVLDQYDVLDLLCVATSGTKFVELGRSANS